MERREIGIQADIPLRRRRGRLNEQEKAIFDKGKRAGIWLANNIIFPVPLDAMSQRLLNAVAMDAPISGYSNMREAQLKEALRARGINKATFKVNRDGRRQLLTK
jgi:hypothetical protein